MPACSVTYVDPHEYVVFLSPVSHPSHYLPLITEKHTFSSPMVNLPCVSALFSANARNFLMASFCRTDSANLTLDFVYSCPGCARQTERVSTAYSQVTHPRLLPRYLLRRQVYRQAETQAFRSTPCAFLQHLPRRICHILRSLIVSAVYLSGSSPASAAPNPRVIESVTPRQGQGET
jgi:hypothetical protein